MKALEIVSYSDLTPVANDPKLSRQLMEIERDVWGYKSGTSEYARCTDDDCSRVLSTEDVYGTNDSPEEYRPLKALEANGIQLPCCPDCQEPMELLMKPESFLVYNQAYFRGAFGAILMDAQKNPQGMVNGVRGKRDNIIKEIDYRNSYNPNDCLQQMAKMLGEELKPENPMEGICLNKIFILPNMRGGRHFRPLIKTLLEIHPEVENLPLIADTSFTSRYYRFMRAIAKGNSIDVATDKHGWVLTVLPRSGAVREAASVSQQEFEAEFGKYYREAAEEQEAFIRDEKPFEKPKYYRNVLRLPDDPQILLSALQT